MARITAASTILSCLLFTSPTAAWGSLGHNTVALIAQSFLSPQTVNFTQSLLNDTSSTFLANVATWADSYRSTAEGRFSGVFHYIDALDTPPESCDVDFDRDCPEEGCIVSAIANYTTRVQSSNLSFVERQKALKWVIHFVGDIHQPLHVENLAVGGNQINVTFEGESANLHRIWDSDMPEKLIGGYAMADAQDWSTSLLADIKPGGKYANQSATWLTGLNLEDPIASSMHWAQDSNAYVCSTVVPEGQEGVEGKELEGEYYDSAIPVIQQQIAKAGVRLAAWLNLIVTGQPGVSLTGYGAVGNKIAIESPPAAWGKRDVKLEDWMVEARRVRRAFGSDCGPAGHHH
ncbi:hypothetical protein DM02DRAFT_611806 [Periconia macrospinosa]|uniref:Nuclease PA3 n=1 Tax=Periconia macrospinosa TaxID=97972 RepID=A0A2V1E0T0_9PLEO|nr:hypothetical protein DM02DRAFT_611806 [Periconia macrospinosa]